MLPEVEKELIKKIQSKGARFYEPVVRAYEGPGIRLAMGMLGNHEDARDALQEAFIKAYNSLSRFDTKRLFGPWFFQILRNQCRDMLRSRQSRGRHETRDERLEFRPADLEKGPERTYQRKAAKALVWEALSHISEEHREIIVLKELEGFRYSEIASILEIPEGTVASRLYHARDALKTALLDMDVEYDDDDDDITIHHNAAASQGSICRERRS